MLSLEELSRAAAISAGKLAGTVLHRAYQPDDFRLALAFRNRESETIVQLSCRPGSARVSLLAEAPPSAKLPPSFLQYVRAHLVHAAFGGISVAEMDRQMSIRLLTQAGVFELIFSILGARSNVYLVNQEGKLVHSMRSLEDTRRELILGGMWTKAEGVLRSRGVDRWETAPDCVYLETVEHYYRTLEQAGEVEAIARKIENALNKEESFLNRKAVNLQEDLGEARRAEEYRHKGELLKNVLHRIRPGDSIITAIDYETDSKVAIPLDASLSPAENLEAYFGRYQKELRGVTAIEQQLEAVRRAQGGLEQMRAGLRRITASTEPDLQALEDFTALPQVRRLLGRYHPKARPEPPVKPAAGQKAVPGKLLPKRYRTQDGLEIWVGRNEESNDYLTTRLARGNDLFFHMEGYPGSHVILRTEGRIDPPSESMLAACELAVHFSKLKNSGRADVHVAHIKDVKKPKGAKKGLVYVARGKTIHLRRNAKRLEDILSSRLDE